MSGPRPVIGVRDEETVPTDPTSVLTDRCGVAGLEEAIAVGQTVDTPGAGLGAEPGDAALLAGLAGLAGRSDRLVLGLMDPGQARLRRVSALAADDTVVRLEEIYRRDRARLVQIAARRMRLRDDAEDVLHDAYLRVTARAANPGPLDRIIEPERYLTTAVLREAGRANLRKHTEHGGEELMAEMKADDPVPTGIEDESLLEALNHLSRKQRECTVLRLVYGYDTAETAVLLGMTTAAVTTTLHRALTRLRQLLHDYHR